MNLNEEDAGDQDLFARVERARRWRGTVVVHIVRLCLMSNILAQCARGKCVHGTR